MFDDSRKDNHLAIEGIVLEKLDDAVTSAVRKAFKNGVCVNDEATAVGNIFKDIISSEVYWKVHNSVLLDNDILMSRERHGSSYVTLSKKQIEDLSESLFHPTLRHRLKAMEYMIRCVSTDSFSSLSCWERLESGLQLNLTHTVSIISEASLQVYKKILISSIPEISLESYVGLLRFLKSVLHREFSVMPLKNEEILVDIVQLINKYQKNIPKHWVRYPESIIMKVVSTTFESYEECQWKNEHERVGLAHYLWLADPKALWINNFLCGIVSRKTVFKSISCCKYFILNLLETCHLYLEYELQEISYVIHSISILLRLLEYKQGLSCLLELLSEVSEATANFSETQKLYNSSESLWDLLFHVCCNLLIIEGTYWLTALFFKAIKRQLQESSEEYFVLWLLNKMSRRENIVTVFLASDCTCKVSYSAAGKKLLWKNNTCLSSVLEQLLMKSYYDLPKVSFISAEMLTTIFLKIIGSLLQETSGIFNLSPREFLQILSLLNKDTFLNNNEHTSSLMSIVKILAENELCAHKLAENSQCLDLILENGLEKIAQSKDNVILYCLKVSYLHVEVLERNVQVLLNLFKRYDYNALCKHSDHHQWNVCINHQLQSIPYYTCSMFCVIQKAITESGCSGQVFPWSGISISCVTCSELFNWHLLNYLICDVNMLLYLQAHYNINKMLLEQECTNGTEDVLVVDECSLLRNHILVRISTIGGPKERSLPDKLSCKSSDNSEFLSDISIYVSVNKCVSSVACEPLEQFHKKELVTYFTKLITSSMLSLENCSTFIGFLINEIEELDFEEFNPSEISEIESRGVDLTLKYGKSQNILSHENEEINNRSLCSLICEAKRSTFYNDSGYNFLSATIYIISGGDLQTSARFYKFLESQSGNLTITEFVNSVQIEKPNKVKGVLCTAFDAIVQAELPLYYNAFVMAGLSPYKCFTLWVGQCFWNVLNLGQIGSVIVFSALHNTFFLLYVSVVLLKQCGAKILYHFEEGDLISFIREYSAEEFDLADHLDFLNYLNDKYTELIERKLKE